MKRYLLSIPLAFLFEPSSHAYTLPEMGRPLPAAPQFADENAASYDFTGIVALSNCSGSLVRFDDSLDSDKAMVLSNGHCTGMIDPGVVIVNQANTRSFDLFNSAAQKIGSVKAEKLLYATMTKTDMSLYQLKDSYQDILTKFKIPALTLSRDVPAVGNEIEVISGYWKKGYSCEIQMIVDTLREGDWSFEDSIRYSQTGCDTIGGTSGSPVLAAGTRTVVAVNNTGNDAGRKCEVNNPCEVDAAGNVIYKKGYNYAQQTYWLYSCRNDLGKLDWNVEGCLMPKPANWGEAVSVN